MLYLCETTYPSGRSVERDWALRLAQGERSIPGYVVVNSRGDPSWRSVTTLRRLERLPHRPPEAGRPYGFIATKRRLLLRGHGTMRVRHAVPLRKLTKPGAVRESPLLVTLEAFSRERLERLGMITSLLHEHVDVRGSLPTTCT